MLQDIVNSLRWSVSLNNKLWRVVPAHTIVGVAATVLSQLALLIAFFLPLKVILLLGSDRIPRYFPEAFISFDRNWLIVALSSAALVFYFFHLLAERISILVTSVGANKLLARNRKMVMFDKQDLIASRAYQRYSQALASLVFVFIFLPLLWWLNPALGLVFSCYVVLVILSVFIACGISVRLYRFFTNKFNEFCAIMAGLGFLLCFVFMVMEFLWFESRSVLVSVVCLLLFRQLFKHITTFIKELSGLIKIKSQLSALFFHGHNFSDPSIKKLEGLWELVEPDRRDLWIRQVLSDFLDENTTLVSVSWIQLGIADLVCYQVRVLGCVGQQEFLLKVFNSNRSALAKHEATLLTGNYGLPSLELIKIALIDDIFHCHVFLLAGIQQLESKKVADLDTVEIGAKLLSCKANQELCSLFMRSKPSLAQRLNRSVVQRLRYVISTEEDLIQLETFEQAFDRVYELLSELPLVVINPDIRKGTIFKSEDGTALVGHWSRWSLEPIGSGWPVDAESLAKLDEVFRQSINEHSELQKIKASNVRLSALLFAFERLFRRQDYDGAIRLISAINESLN